MYQRIILLHVNDLIQVIFAARFIWTQHSNMTTLLFHRKTCDLFFLKIIWFCLPWWFCYQVLICCNTIPPCDQHENIIPSVELNVVKLKDKYIIKGRYGLWFFVFNKTSIQNSFVQFTMGIVRYCLLGCQWHTPVLTVNN